MLDVDAVAAQQELDALLAARVAHLVPVAEPLALISQLQRSGGTLLSQLLDGHPELHVHPGELKIGWPKKHDWPPLDLAAGPSEWFEILDERIPAATLRDGYRKYSRAAAPEAVDEVFPFTFSPWLQRELFLLLAAGSAPGSVREILDIYFTSYFNAWLDNRNLRTRAKKAVVAFVPRLMYEAANRSSFFDAYPDGLLITLVRDPRSWWCSAREHQPGRYGDLDTALKTWRSYAEASCAARAERPDRVALLRYEDLLDDTDAVLRRLAGRIGITPSDELLTPTFNGWPIKSNSTRAVAEHGIITEPRDRYLGVLTGDELTRIAALVGDTLERVQSAVS